MLSSLVIGAAVSILGSLVSSIASSSAAAKAEEQQRARRNAAERRYLHEINKNFLDTDTAKSTLGAIRKQNDKQIEALGNNAIKTGASDEAKIAAAARANETYADAASRIAGYGTQYKQNLEDRYLSQMDQFDDSLINIEREKTNAWAGMGNAATALGNSVAEAHGAGVFSKTPVQTPAVATPVQTPVNTNSVASGAPSKQDAATIAQNAVAPSKGSGLFVQPHTVRWKRDLDQMPIDKMANTKSDLSERVKIGSDAALEKYGYDLSMKDILWQR